MLPKLEETLGAMYCNMTLLFLPAWLAARLVTSCLKYARALKQEQTGR